MQFTIVSEVPRTSSGACLATNVENNGESAITTSPQKNRKTINTTADLAAKNKGEEIQQRHDRVSATVATVFAPYDCAR